MINTIIRAWVRRPATIVLLVMCAALVVYTVITMASGREEMQPEKDFVNGALEQKQLLETRQKLISTAAKKVSAVPRPGVSLPVVNVSLISLNEKIPFTDLSESESKSKAAFWKSHKASLKCPRRLLTRVGKETGDGGKWVCGLETFGRVCIKEEYKCVMYSFGVSTDSHFESAILMSTSCSVFAYDPSVNRIGRPLTSDNPRVQFRSIGIGGSNTGKTKTLKTLMAENGHTFIDILKIDVESAEYSSFERIFKDFDLLPFGQLLLEAHNFDWSPTGKNKVLDMLRTIEKRGFRMFSTEPNVFALDSCQEYSFINLLYLPLFVPVEEFPVSTTSSEYLESLRDWQKYLSSLLNKFQIF